MMHSDQADGDGFCGEQRGGRVFTNNRNARWLIAESLILVRWIDIDERFFFLSKGPHSPAVAFSSFFAFFPFLFFFKKKKKTLCKCASEHTILDPFSHGATCIGCWAKDTFELHLGSCCRLVWFVPVHGKSSPESPRSPLSWPPFV